MIDIEFNNGCNIAIVTECHEKKKRKEGGKSKIKDSQILLHILIHRRHCLSVRIRHTVRLAYASTYSGVPLSSGLVAVDLVVGQVSELPQVPERQNDRFFSPSAVVMRCTTLDNFWYACRYTISELVKYTLSRDR